MGCDTHIYLPADVRVSDVATVMAALAGSSVTKKELSGSCWVASSVGHKVLPCDNQPSLVTINLSLPCLDGESNHFCYYHFEESTKGEKLLSPRSTPYWIAMGMRLIKFFGGSIDFNDCEGDGVNISCGKPRSTNFVEDGEEWIKFQQDILDIEPISKEEILQCVEHAGYKDFDYIDKFKEEASKNFTEVLLDVLMPINEEEK